MFSDRGPLRIFKMIFKPILWQYFVTDLLILITVLVFQDVTFQDDTSLILKSDILTTLTVVSVADVFHFDLPF